MLSSALLFALILVDSSMSLVTPTSVGSRQQAHFPPIHAGPVAFSRPIKTKKIPWLFPTISSSTQRMLPTTVSFLTSIRGGTGDLSPADSTLSPSDENLQGIFLMALSAFSFSLMFLGVKLYSNAPTFTLVFYRSVVQTILSLMVLLRGGQTNPLGPPDCRKLLLLRGFFGSLAVAAFFFAIQSLPLPDAITLQFTTPVFAALMAVPLLGEPWNRSDQLGALVCLAGVMLIARPSWLFGVHVVTKGATGVALAATTLPTTIGLVGAALAALAYVLVRRIGNKADANVMVLYYAVISGLTAPLGSKLLGGSDSWNVMGNPTPTELFVFAGLGVFGFFGQLFTNKGLTKCDSAATATLVSNTQIVFAFLFEIAILHESISLWSLAGTALIVGYMVITGVSKMSGVRKMD